MCLMSTVMTCTKIVLTDTPTVMIPGGRFIVLRDATSARVRLKKIELLVRADDLYRPL